MCGVCYSLWLGTEDGQIIILDLISKHELFKRYLSVHSNQAIVGLYHLVSLRSGFRVQGSGEATSLIVFTVESVYSTRDLAELARLQLPNWDPTRWLQ